VQSIQKLLNDTNLRQQFGAKSYEIARNRFDLKIMTENYFQTYQQLLQENKN
jgi:glycosyltransferase involved in cell wall biosynthesis